MELSQLRMVKAVAECGSIALAAEQLHCVPSNITTRIKQLESELGTALFTRAGRGLRISAAGQVFLGYSEQILALVDQAQAFEISTDEVEPVCLICQALKEDRA